DLPLEERGPGATQPSPPVATLSTEAPERAYSPWRSLLPRSWLPLIELADGAVKVGVVTFGQDALGLHQYSVAPVIELTQQELLGDASYVYDGRHQLLVGRSMTVRETVDDEVQAYTIEEGAQWLSTWRHLALNRRFYWGLGGALERESLHRVDGPTSPQQAERGV